MLWHHLHPRTAADQISTSQTKILLVSVSKFYVVWQCQENDTHEISSHIFSEKKNETKYFKMSTDAVVFDTLTLSAMQTVT